MPVGPVDDLDRRINPSFGVLECRQCPTLSWNDCWWSSQLRVVCWVELAGRLNGTRADALTVHAHDQDSISVF